MGDEEFEFLKRKRVEFLKKRDYFWERPPEGRKVEEKDASGSPTNEDLKRGIHRYTPCYEPSNMIYTRDSLYWSWRRVKEYYRDFLGIEDEGRGKKDIRIDPQIRK